jgi:hypothetical protein
MEDTRKYSSGSEIEIELNDIEEGITNEIEKEIEEETKREIIDKIVDDLIESSMVESILMNANIPIDDDSLAYASSIYNRKLYKDTIIPIENNETDIRVLVGLSEGDLDIFMRKVYFNVAFHMFSIIILSCLVRDNTNIAEFVKENGILFILSVIPTILLPILFHIKSLIIREPYDKVLFLSYVLSSSYCLSITGTYDFYNILLGGFLSILILFTGNYIYTFNAKPLPSFSTQMMWLSFISTFCFSISAIYTSGMSFGIVLLSLLCAMLYVMILFGNINLLTYDCEENTSSSNFTMKIYSNSIFVFGQVCNELYEYITEHLPSF